MKTTEEKGIQAQDSAAPRRDYRQEVTKQIIEMLEKGTAPWQKPWEAGATALPFNPTSDRSYRGGNALHLIATAARKGFTDPRWLTYRQAQENGWQVRPGEKGTQIEYWQFGDRGTRGGAGDKTPEAPSPNDHGESATKQPPLHRVYTVFNAQQIEGVPAQEPKRLQEWEVAKPASRSSKTRAQASPTTKAIKPSTAGLRMPFTFPPRTLSGRPQTTTEPLSMSWRTGPDIQLALTVKH